ncbi:MAG: CDP-glycerol glycerophosphotransferase family protein [Clostridiales Family XIII bacterium]|nr:CDP-glycerol glycerophosphotransferase family protein [Clostridiales Family XIII bacterium]
MIRCAVALLNFVYWPIKLFVRQRARVVLISDMGGAPTRDIAMLAQALRPAMDAAVIAGRMDRSAGGAAVFAGMLLRQMCAIAGSKAVVLERYSVAVCALKHKKGTVVVQLWHAPEAIKKFGWQTVDTPAGHAAGFDRAMRVHRGYDYILCPADATLPFFEAAFEAPAEKFVKFGLPSLDYIAAVMAAAATAGTGVEADDLGDSVGSGILREALTVRMEIEARYPALSERPTVVYAPTYRDGRMAKADDLIAAFDFERFNLVLKMHPLEQAARAAQRGRSGRRGPESAPRPGQERLIEDRDFDTIDWYGVCSAVVTDYSGVAVEAAAAGVPSYYYLYDPDDYEQERGLNVDLRGESIGKYCFEGAEGLMAQISADFTDGGYDAAALRAFRDKYIEVPLTGNTERLAEFIRTIL